MFVKESSLSLVLLGSADGFRNAKLGSNLVRCAEDLDLLGVVPGVLHNRIAAPHIFSTIP